MPLAGFLSSYADASLVWQIVDRLAVFTDVRVGLRRYDLQEAAFSFHFIKARQAVGFYA